MARYVVPPKQLAKLFKEHEAARMRRVAAAVHEAAALGAEVVASKAPVDLGGIKASTRAESLDETHARIVTDAPHAAAVEAGARPHTPPLQPLIDWVRRHKHLFSAAGTPKGLDRVARARKKVSLRARVTAAIRGARRAARRYVAKALRRLVVGVYGKKTGGGRRAAAGTPINARAALDEARIEQIARGIQGKIAKHGTKPTWFTKNQLPLLGRILGQIVLRRIKDPP